MSFIQENILIFLILLPIVYILSRDIIGIFNRKRRKKEDEIRLRESEDRILKLMKQLDINREALMKQLSTIQNKITLPSEEENIDTNEQKRS
tara:strand:+ start:128 stop:403 length:276 start_codon:yes stop_codon:yes gene_type:complete